MSDNDSYEASHQAASGNIRRFLELVGEVGLYEAASSKDYADLAASEAFRVMAALYGTMLQRRPSAELLDRQKGLEARIEATRARGKIDPELIEEYAQLTSKPEFSAASTAALADVVALLDDETAVQPAAAPVPPRPF
jgi:hypothetical protein